MRTPLCLLLAGLFVIFLKTNGQADLDCSKCLETVKKCLGGCSYIDGHPDEKCQKEKCSKYSAGCPDKCVLPPELQPFSEQAKPKDEDEVETEIKIIFEDEDTPEL